MLEQLVEKTSFKDVFIILIGSFALVAFWRGTWGFFDLYLFPEDLNWSFGVSIAMSLVVFFTIAWYKKDRFKKMEKKVEQKVEQVEKGLGM